MFSFEELDAWKTGREFKIKAKKVACSFPKSEEYRLKDQIFRSARSITANIAEGFGRFHHQENIQFCRQSRGSLTETLDHLIEAFDCNYISEEELNNLRKEYDRCLHVINGYIAYLKRAKENKN
ncbi:MAG: four helix bundle protein [Bacteroidia bacterium]